MKRLKIFFHTLGCSKNLVDSEVLSGTLHARGFALTHDVSEADISVINTCSFIQDARDETYQEINKLISLKKQKHGDFIIIVTGCLMKNQEVSRLQKNFPEIDAFISPDDYTRFPEILKKMVHDRSFRPSAGVTSTRGHALFRPVDYQKKILMTPKYYSYIKIAEGCSNNCAYCTIPLIRGALKSRNELSILQEIRKFIGKGVKEFNLVAQDLTSWGSDRFQRSRFIDLLKRIVRIRGEFWVRLLYLHPKGINRELLDLIINEEKICSYIDMPVQHINDGILKVMNRNVTRKQIENILEYGRTRSRDLTFRTTLIVGFPGETQKAFRELENFVHDARFDRLGVFTYSREPDTGAGRLPRQIQEKIKKQRLDRIMTLQAQIAEENNFQKVGRKMRVIVEGPAQGGGFSCWGRSQHEAPEIDPIIYIKSRKKILPGKFIDVNINGYAGYDLLAENMENGKSRIENGR